jgi:molybdenum cofactor cytidylyltransferase
MRYSINNCGILILAAGQSKRLGEPKQLLLYEGQTLLNRMIGIAKNAYPFPITVVLGANAAKIKSQITDKDVDIVINENWEKGMASSIRKGLEAMLQSVLQLDAVFIMLCDQPFISEQQICSLYSLQNETDRPIAACYYAGISGTPALFHRSVFPELLSLEGDTGAKKIIKARENDVAKLHFEKGVIDIDTLDDYKNLISGDL